MYSIYTFVRCFSDSTKNSKSHQRDSVGEDTHQRPTKLLKESSSDEDDSPLRADGDVH